MDILEIMEKFEAMGARARVGPVLRNFWDRFGAAGDVRIDVRRDGQGEYFDLQAEPGKAAFDVVDVRPRERHLLLMARLDTGRKDKFLCGHDERAWFVAAVPGERGVSNVRTAMEALKPAAVQAEQARRAVKFADRTRRRTAAYIRQGEWFFVPAPNIRVDSRLVFSDEPIRRGNGKPHICEYLVRQGGVMVYVSTAYPNGVTEAEYHSLLQRKPGLRKLRWRVMRRDAGVFVRGRVRHPDHKTVVLNGWHRVQMNTETQAPAMRHVAFLD